MLSPDARAVAGWLQLFLRALKTARLYGAGSPASQGFRDQACATIVDLVRAHGTIALQFAPSEVHYHEHVVHRSHGRDDRLAILFFRDGIQSLSFESGLESSEVDILMERVARMLGHDGRSEDDLVTLLWDADLPHLTMRYVSAETHLDPEDGGHDRGRTASLGPPMGWPSDAPVAGVVSAGPADTGSGASALALASASDAIPMNPSEAATRSEDWRAGEPPTSLDAGFSHIESQGPAAMTRFLAERELERAMEPRTALLGLIEQVIGQDTGASSLVTLVPALKRIAQDSIHRADWAQATPSCVSLQRLGGDESVADLCRALARPDSVVSRALLQRLDAQPQAELPGFVQFAGSLGHAAAPWLIQLRAESQQQRVRRELVAVVATLSRTQLDAIDRSLDDARWYVVRNLAVALRTLGGEPVVPLLARIAGHPEPRVRTEVLNALAEVPSELARPILLGMLETTEVRQLSGALRQLASGPDAELRDRLTLRLQLADFPQRTPEEHRAVLAALALAGAGDVAELLARLLSPAQKPAECPSSYPTSLAQALARIATPEARAALEQARGSRWPAGRDAATLALAAMRRS